MAVDFKLPQLAEGIETADVAAIHVAPGDSVTAGQIVMELETEKAVMELPCPHAGKIAQILVKKGQTVKVGQPILQIDGATAGTNGDAAAAKSGAAAAPAKSQAAAPSAATSTTPRPPVVAAIAATAVARAAGTPLPAGPATRRMARELGVSLESIAGSGSGGRITTEDVARAFAARTGGGGGPALKSLPDFSSFGPSERQAYSKLQRTAAAHLSYCWQTIPHVTQHDLADITEVEAARRRFQESLGKGGPKVTMTAVTMKAVVACLKEFPQFNASYDAEKAEVVLKKYYHIGVAVDTPNGLVVPVVRNVDQKTVLQLATEMTALAEKARSGKLELKDMQGGTFTITNLGGIGGTAFTPIVNWPEVAILGMSRSSKQLQLSDGQVIERLMLPLSMSYDHRVINGADAARFLVKLSSLFSDAFRLLVEC